MTDDILPHVTIDGLDGQLRGIHAHPHEGDILVPGAAPGDQVTLRITARSQHHRRAFADVTEVHRRGPGFREPPCRHAAPLRGRCGGCPGLHLLATTRQAALAHSVSSALQDLGLSPTFHAAPAELGYRNRSNFVAARQGGRILLGSFAPGTREVAAMTGCLVVDPAIATTHQAIEALLNDLDIPIGLDELGLRWVSLRAASGHVVIDLITAVDAPAWLSPLAGQLFALDAVQGVSHSHNPRPGNAIRVAPSTPLLGDTTLTENYGRTLLEIPAGAFAQLNVAAASQIYEDAARHAADARILWDLYCGIGGLGLNAALTSSGSPRGALLWGVESIDAALDAARRNAARAGVDAHFTAADLTCADTLSSLRPPPDRATPDAILVNPPRKGLSPAIRHWLTDLPGDFPLIYMSCNPSTFARDAQLLLQSDRWHLRDVTAYEMLPQTHHVELLGLFAPT